MLVVVFVFVVVVVNVHDFCTYSTTYSQTYLFLMVAEQYEDPAVDRYVVLLLFMLLFTFNVVIF